MKWAVDSQHPWRGKTQLLRTPAASGVRVDAASGVRVEGLGFGVFGSGSGLRVKGLGRVSPRPLEIPKRASLILDVDMKHPRCGSEVPVNCHCRTC